MSISPPFAMPGLRPAILPVNPGRTAGWHTGFTASGPGMAWATRYRRRYGQGGGRATADFRR